MAAERGRAAVPDPSMASSLWWAVGAARWDLGKLRGADRALLASMSLRPQDAGPAFARVNLLVARERQWAA